MYFSRRGKGSISLSLELGLNNELVRTQYIVVLMSNSPLKYYPFCMFENLDLFQSPQLKWLDPALCQPSTAYDSFTCIWTQYQNQKVINIWIHHVWLLIPLKYQSIESFWGLSICLNDFFLIYFTINQL